MEPSQIFGGEECHSCESGWTMYIGDDADDHNSSDAGDNNDDENDKKAGKNYGREDDSDDSMASDASSGPSHQKGMPHYKHEEEYKDDEDDGRNYHFQRKGEKVEKKTNERRKKGEKQEEMAFMARGRNGPSQSGSRVSKSFWMGKRK